MGSAFHQLCPRYSGTLTPTAPTAIRLWETFTLTITVIILRVSIFRIFMVHEKVCLYHQDSVSGLNKNQL